MSNPTFLWCGSRLFCGRSQSGVAMVVAMIMLIVIGLMSASVMRGALTSDLVANNARAQVLAQQAAETALRYCERQASVISNIQTPPNNTGNPNIAPPPLWNVFSSWHGVGKVAVDVPSGVMKSADSAYWPSKAPQCLAENSVLPDWPANPTATPIVIVTARGFSPDYSEDSAGRSQSGSVVWLQSTVKFD